VDHPRPSIRLDPAACDPLLHTALAKREDKGKGQLSQSYFEHVSSVYYAWCGLKDVHAALITRVAFRYGITTERLLQSSLVCVALHDVGKLSCNFQAMMRAVGDAEYKEAIRGNYRHEVAALWLVTQVALALNELEGPLPSEGLLETFAVAGHHKYLADGYLLDGDKFLNKTLAWEHGALADINAAVGLARLMFKQQGWKFPRFKVSQDELTNSLTYSPGDKTNGPFGWLEQSVDELPYGEARLRDLFALLKGLLMTADWMASGAKGQDDALDASRGVIGGISPGAVEDYLRERHERRSLERPELGLGPFAGYKPFQADCAAAEGHVIATAPTGSGKTEASWLWALGQVERGHARKVILLLPTMVTANSIHQRLVAFFDLHGHEVGLVHSTADLVRGETNDGEDEADRADVRADHLSETHFFRPVTVGTVDQLLVPLLHAGRWAMKTLAAAGAAVVIDEVHAYEPHTLGLISLLIRQLAPLGTRFMVMSATMPRALKAVIRAALASDEADAPPIGEVEDDDLLDSARNTWETCGTPLIGWLFNQDSKDRLVPSPEFLELWGRRNDRGAPQKILIVVNTVKRCQDLAKSLGDFAFELVCYHSKFIFEDRRAKERRINEKPPRLLIATQVVEVSLDIDYDILLTECAPIDALVQRAGRVNRTRRCAPGRVVVHRHEEESEIIYKYPPGVLDATWALCEALHMPPTERDLIALVEQVYQGHDPAGSAEFRQIQESTRQNQRRLAGILDSPRPREDDDRLMTRTDDYPQVSVIPQCFEAEAKACLPAQRKRFELKVPIWYARQKKVATDDLPICPMGYDPGFGAVLLPDDKHPEPGYEIF
jgi:CRISPR-associated endonuclease/helicase Cas3